MIEFYGELSLPCKVYAERARKKYYSFWMTALTLIVLALTVANGLTAGAGTKFIVYAVFTLLLAGLSVYLFLAPAGKAPARDKYLLRVRIDGTWVRVVRYADGRESEKKREIGQVRRVVRTQEAYYLYLPDAANIVVCQRGLLKEGSFEELEALFRGKIKEK